MTNSTNNTLIVANTVDALIAQRQRTKPLDAFFTGVGSVCVRCFNYHNHYAQIHVTNAAHIRE